MLLFVLCCKTKVLMRWTIYLICKYFVSHHADQEELIMKTFLNYYDTFVYIKQHVSQRVLVEK